MKEREIGMKNSGRLVFFAVAVVSMIGVGCAKNKKKVAAKEPPPPALAVAPVQIPRRAAQPAHTATATPIMQRPAELTTHYPTAQTRARIDTLLGRIEDAYLDYDKRTLRADAIKCLQADSTELRTILTDYRDYKLTIEGDCDERGSAERDIALGQERAGFQGLPGAGRYSGTTEQHRQLRHGIAPYV